MLSQLLDIPVDDGNNTLVTTTLYVVGALAGGHGILSRSCIKIPFWFCILSFLSIIVGVAYFIYIRPSLIGRVYVVNFGLACMILTYVCYLRKIVYGRKADKLIVGMLLLVGIHFFPRTLLTVHSITDDTLVDFAFTSFWQWTVFSTAVAGVIAGLVLFAAASSDRLEEIAHERDSDHLTGLLNRRGMETHIKALRGRDLSGWIVACDIDYFKTINDDFGHAVGDIVLKEISGVLQLLAQNSKFIARSGGEEFIIYLDDYSPDDAFLLIENVRESVKKLNLSSLGIGENITCSFGAVKLVRQDQFALALERADKLLYAAKKAGRNRTLMESLTP